MAPLLGLRTSGVPCMAQVVDKSESGQLLKFDNLWGCSAWQEIPSFDVIGPCGFCSWELKGAHRWNKNYEFLANCFNNSLLQYIRLFKSQENVGLSFVIFRKISNFVLWSTEYSIKINKKTSPKILVEFFCIYGMPELFTSC